MLTLHVLQLRSMTELRRDLGKPSLLRRIVYVAKPLKRHLLR
jgi:hypothetical protein